MAHPKLPTLKNWSPAIAATGAFTAAECDRVLALGKDLKDGKIMDAGGFETYRESRVTWLRPGPDTNWIFAKAADLVRSANETSFQFELAGFTEPLQLAQYSSAQFYDWHLDLGNDKFSIRKLSFIVQISDENSYEGGEVEVYCEKEPRVMERQRGSIIVFPSYILHRVKQVTQGERWSLVGWIGGPPFR